MAGSGYGQHVVNGHADVAITIIQIAGNGACSFVRPSSSWRPWEKLDGNPDDDRSADEFTTGSAGVVHDKGCDDRSSTAAAHENNSPPPRFRAGSEPPWHHQRRCRLPDKVNQGNTQKAARIPV